MALFHAWADKGGWSETLASVLTSLALDGASDILTMIYTNNCKDKMVLFYIGISTKCKNITK